MDSFEFKASDGKQIHCYHWPAQGEPKAIVHIAHGMGEHAARYDWAASKLAQAGYEVQANDHRAHGLTVHRGGLIKPSSSITPERTARSGIWSVAPQSLQYPCMVNLACAPSNMVK